MHDIIQPDDGSTIFQSRLEKLGNTPPGHKAHPQALRLRDNMVDFFDVALWTITGSGPITIAATISGVDAEIPVLSAAAAGHEEDRKFLLYFSSLADGSDLHGTPLDGGLIAAPGTTILAELVAGLVYEVLHNSDPASAVPGALALAATHSGTEDYYPVLVSGDGRKLVGPIMDFT